jgi:hypothetical protein
MESEYSASSQEKGGELLEKHREKSNQAQRQEGEHNY